MVIIFSVISTVYVHFINLPALHFVCDCKLSTARSIAAPQSVHLQVSCISVMQLTIELSGGAAARLEFRVRNYSSG